MAGPTPFICEVIWGTFTNRQEIRLVHYWPCGKARMWMGWFTTLTEERFGAEGDFFVCWVDDDGRESKWSVPWRPILPAFYRLRVFPGQPGPGSWSGYFSIERIKSSTLTMSACLAKSMSCWRTNLLMSLR